ncbi:related to IRC3 - putative RNA helicase of the DEAH/D-box family [Ustilago trichophora]|uniref:Related to IRC3 - putative RNA helicase of the DEAH/D-box family n=1 Tax=Ustilago trichophora TaxID=86804 RepID=A0A5C3E5A5_9BASI|nr:related to IRC3 - putative RNA helicase of the DEAH/D-box family [Ustilago trichophora]
MAETLLRALHSALPRSAHAVSIRHAARALSTSSWPSRTTVAQQALFTIHYRPHHVQIQRFYSTSVAEATTSHSTDVPPASDPPESSSFSLRPYQEECIQDCLSALSSGVTRIGVSSPTGSGKTTIFTHLIDRLPPQTSGGDRVLIIVNSIELALQAANAVTSMFPAKSVEIEQGSKYKASGLADVTVATYQTLNRSQERLNKFDPADFKAVVVDEAHHAAAPSYLKVLSHFDPQIGLSLEERQTSAASSVPVIGFSATFSRHDGLALGKVFDRIVFHKDFLEMIGEKWLCPIRFTSIKADIDLPSVKISNLNSDFATSSLASVVNTEVVNRIVLKAWIDRAHTRRRTTLIFAVNIEHVQDLTATFRNAGIDARYLHGGTPMLERRQLLEDFRAGKYPVLVNCAILTEGADVPAIDCVLLARPTRSRNLFSQMIGRGLRLSPKTGKKDCLVLDIVGNIEKGVVCTPTLFGLNADDIIEDESAEGLLERSHEAESFTCPAQEESQDPFEISLSDPTRITYIDYEDPAALQSAMLSRSTVVETLSPNAWVDCGGQVYILDVPRYGFVTVERHSASPGETDSEEKVWTAWFTPSNADADEAAASSPSSTFNPYKKFAGGSPYRRPRHILFSPTLESAVRGSDVYVQKSVLRNSPQLFAMLNRRAAWRATRATDSQRRLVEKRLGLSKVPASPADAAEGGEGKEGRKKKALTSTSQLTKGQASVILTRLLHGAKSRWRDRVKRANKVWREGEKERARKERELVKVGPLGAH